MNVFHSKSQCFIFLIKNKNVVLISNVRIKNLDWHLNWRFKKTKDLVKEIGKNVNIPFSKNPSKMEHVPLLANWWKYGYVFRCDVLS